MGLITLIQFCLFYRLKQTFASSEEFTTVVYVDVDYSFFEAFNNKGKHIQ